MADETRHCFDCAHYNHDGETGGDEWCAALSDNIDEPGGAIECEYWDPK